jgi:hypothetical protein
MGPTASAKSGFLVFTNVGWLLRKTLGYQYGYQYFIK